MNTPEKQVRYIRVSETEEGLKSALWIRLGEITWEQEKEWCQRHAEAHPEQAYAQSKIERQ